jgi:hypothetical protein
MCLIKRRSKSRRSQSLKSHPAITTSPFQFEIPLQFPRFALPHPFPPPLVFARLPPTVVRGTMAQSRLLPLHNLALSVGTRARQQSRDLTAGENGRKPALLWPGLLLHFWGWWSGRAVPVLLPAERRGVGRRRVAAFVCESRGLFGC